MELEGVLAVMRLFRKIMGGDSPIGFNRTANDLSGVEPSFLVCPTSVIPLFIRQTSTFNFLLNPTIRKPDPTFKPTPNPKQDYTQTSTF